MGVLTKIKLARASLNSTNTREDFFLNIIIFGLFIFICTHQL